MAAVAEQHSRDGSGTLCANWSHRPDKVNPQPLIPRALLIGAVGRRAEAERIATVRHRAPFDRNQSPIDAIIYTCG
jgi:hypothetical protein